MIYPTSIANLGTLNMLHILLFLYIIPLYVM